MARFLVTGGGGFIGSSLSAELLSRGERVRILDDFSTGRRQNVESLSGAVELVEGTITDPETVARAMKGVEVVFHQAAIPSVARSVDDPQLTMRVGVLGTTVVLDVARHSGVRRVIFAASSSVYGNVEALPQVETMPPRPLSPYALSKQWGEEMMRISAALYGLEMVSLRYFNVFGPRQDPSSEYAAVIPKFITSVLRKTRPVIFGDGEQTRDFCYIDDTVGANLLAASTAKKLEGQVVNVACGERTSLNQLLRILSAIAVERGDAPPGYAAEAEHREPRRGDLRDSLAAIDAARSLLGYEPQVDVREGLRRTYDAFRTLTRA